MGKSPAKWIKTILFGKKSSKSSFLKKSTTDKEANLACKAASGGLAANPSVISDVVLHTSDRIEENSERKVISNLPQDVVVLLPEKQAVVIEGTAGLAPADIMEFTRQEQAATKAQAAFRGYLARRAFRALKGIIRLQALIRGHLVRRQVVATLHCMKGIVKLQALVRGRRARLSVCGLEVEKKCCLVELFGLHSATRPDKLSANGFICKVLSSSLTIMPLNLQYDPVEPNSAWKWLERWSSSQFWGPLPRPKGVPNSNSSRHQDSTQRGENERGRVKRAGRKVPINVENNSLHPTTDSEKSRRNIRKAMVHQAESFQEHPQYELERVKRSLRKVGVSNSLAPDQSEAATEKPKLNMRKLSSSTASDVPQKSADSSSEKINDPIGLVSKDSKLPEREMLPKPLALEETVDMLHHDSPASERLPLETVAEIDNIPMVNEELDVKEDQASKEKHRSRRKSFPAKQENSENVSQSTHSFPSYMAATESAKAKLRAQGYPMLAEDGIENGSVRRHSLPTSANSKLSSMSPRVQRPVQANGKGGRKSDKSVSSSKDGQDKVAREGWKR